MKPYKVGRRELLKLGAFAGFGMIASCGRGFFHPVLRATPETLPKQWRRTLPAPWRYKPIFSEVENQSFFFKELEKTDLIAIGDGWLKALSQKDLQPIQTPRLADRLNPLARDFLNGLEVEMASCVLPVALSPWALAFRNGEKWLEDASAGWEVLLEPGLRGKVLLPQSPRLIVNLADKIDYPDALLRLREQALTFDDRHGLNWILQGKGRVAVLPLQRCLSGLRSDPRLRVVVPRVGAPLNWSLLVRPATSREPVPQAWVEKAWKMPLMSPLIAGGWIPPLSFEEIEPALNTIPESLRISSLPSQDILSRCWSLPELSQGEQILFEQRWNESTP